MEMTGKRWPVSGEDHGGWGRPLCQQPWGRPLHQQPHWKGLSSQQPAARTADGWRKHSWRPRDGGVCRAWRELRGPRGEAPVFPEATQQRSSRMRRWSEGIWNIRPLDPTATQHQGGRICCFEYVRTRMKIIQQPGNGAPTNAEGEAVCSHADTLSTSMRTCKKAACGLCVGTPSFPSQKGQSRGL